MSFLDNLLGSNGCNIDGTVTRNPFTAFTDKIFDTQMVSDESINFYIPNDFIQEDQSSIQYNSNLNVNNQNFHNFEIPNNNFMSRQVNIL
jgi:hypothetical protein